MMRYEANCRWQYDRALRNLLSLRKAAADQPQEPGVAKTIKFFYCAHAGDGLCDASNPHEKCPKREPCNADEVPPGASPFTPEPNEPNPTNEHLHDPKPAADREERTTHDERPQTNDPTPIPKRLI